VKKIFYEKIGKRYRPVREYDTDFMDAFPKGATLVVCRPGATSYMYNVDPVFAPMLAAGKYAEDSMSSALVKALECHPKQTLLTERERELWQELKQSFADQDFSIHSASAADAAKAGINALEQEVEKMLTVPAVKLAYDHFITLWALTKEQQKE
jgi:hypothetical protein